MKKIRVAFSQRIIPHYRVPLFKELSERPNIDLTVFYGNGFKSGSQVNAEKIVGFRFKKLFTLFFNYKGVYESKQLRTWHPSLFFHLCFGKYDVVIAEPTTNFYNDIFIYLYCKIFRKKFIWYDAGSVPKHERPFIRRLIDPIVSIFINGSDAYITYNSFSDHSLIRDFRINPEKIFRAQNTIDTSNIDDEVLHFNPYVNIKRKELGLSGYKVAMYIGGIERRKKINNLITATTNLNKDGIQAKALIVGDGPDKDWVIKNMTEIERAHTVFVGKQIEEATLYILLSDVVVLPSSGGLSVIQGFACKKPFIGSELIEHGGIMDYVENGINGFLVKENDIPDLQLALKKVFNDKLLYDSLSSNAYKTSKKITIKKMVDGIDRAVIYSMGDNNIGKRDNLVDVGKSFNKSEIRIRLLFFIESLRSGGKERRLVELIKIISAKLDYTCKIVVMDDVNHFEKQIPSNVEVFVLKRKYFRKDVSVFYKFSKICSAFSPDIIHVWGNMPALYAIPSKLLFHIPMINSQITDAPENIPNGLLSPRVTFMFSDHIIGNSFAGIIAYKTPMNKSSVINNGFNFARIENIKPKKQIREQFGIRTKYVVGMVASFSSFKDYTTFINAGVIVLNKIPDVTFLCIGSGDITPYRKLVPKIYLYNFFFLGAQSDTEAIINIFDIGVLATFTEGISNSIIEYMALEKPVIATEGGGTSELVVDNVTGYLIPQKNEWILSNKILFLLKNSSQRNSMGKLGKNRIIENFSISKMVESHINIYLKYIKPNKN